MVTTTAVAWAEWITNHQLGFVLRGNCCVEHGGTEILSEAIRKDGLVFNFYPRVNSGEAAEKICAGNSAACDEPRSCFAAAST